eukprot:6399153-Amphidinium_carterae.3
MHGSETTVENGYLFVGSFVYRVSRKHDMQKVTKDPLQQAIWRRKDNFKTATDLRLLGTFDA